MTWIASSSRPALSANGTPHASNSCSANLYCGAALTPTMMRPEEITSSVASECASRTGFLRPAINGTTPIFICFVLARGDHIERRERMRQQDRISKACDQRHHTDFYLFRLGRERGHHCQAVRVCPVHARDARAVAHPKVVEAGALGVFGGAPEFIQVRRRALGADPMTGRSEEHTSELQSRGLISYAVF